MKISSIISNRNTTTVLVSKYMQVSKAMSHRALARALNIHHRTWLRYVSGDSSPENRVKLRMARLMNLKTYLALVQAAVAYYKHPPNSTSTDE